MAAESRQERFVRSLLLERFGAELRRIPESATKTPDYELLSGGARAAVVEVKTLEASVMSEATGWKIERRNEHSWSGTRKDNAPARVASHIHKAAKQLQHYAEPKVLVFVNEDTMADVLDLEEAVRGIHVYGSSTTGCVVNTASKRIAEGRIREDRWLIDLYVWIEPKRGPRTVFPTNAPVEHHPATVETIQFRCTSDAGLAVAHGIVGCAPDT
ncbi:MAG: hypothetical protein KC766_15550 [Myxococcales bacterium]|nr:hypothetical protein [Myxococcales bacterium]